MISFLNDYNELAHPRILEDMMALQAQANPGYGEDDHCAKAVDYIKKTIGRDDLDIHFIHGGTAVNIIAIKACLRAYQGVISVDTGHIIGHENGSIEATGHQIIQVPHKDGKITPEAILQGLKANSAEYSVEPKLVYISNATEYGTVYTKADLEAISKVCKENGLYIYMDGARLAAALSSKLCDYSLSDLCNYVDMFTLGGTKNGFLFGEALVLVNPDLRPNIRRIIKQRGAMLAKGYALGIQFETMFKDGLYFELASHALDLAEKLAKVFEDNGIKLQSKQESNLVFPILRKDLAAKLAKDFYFEESADYDQDHMVYRFAVRYANTEEDIKALDQKLKG